MESQLEPIGKVPLAYHLIRADREKLNTFSVGIGEGVGSTLAAGETVSALTVA